MATRSFRCRFKNGFAVFALIVAALYAMPPRAHGFPYPHRRHGRSLLVGYFTDGGLYASTPFFVKDLVANGSARRLDQINYAAASVNDDHCSLADPLADLLTPYAAENSVDGKADDPESPFRGYLHQLQELKQRFPHLRILISLEGRARDFAADASPENRAAFVSSCVDLYIRGRFMPGVTRPGLFDGVDIDWESPRQADAANFLALIQEFRRQMNAVRPGPRLSVAVDQSPAMLPGSDFAAIARLADEIGVMNYDYSGPWSPRTGFLAPLFSRSRWQYAPSIERSIASYEAAGVPGDKILMGLPFYGYGWTGVTDSNNGLFQRGQAVRGDWPYRSIRALAAPPYVFRDVLSQAPWIYNGQTFWTYEDPVSIRYKVSYAANLRLGGVMIWELSGDTTDAELLGSAYRALHHPLKRGVFAAVIAGQTRLTHNKPPSTGASVAATAAN
jgi:chitinase